MKCKSENCNNKIGVTWGEKYDDYFRECRDSNFQKNKYEIRKTFHNGKAHKFKFSTIIYIILGMVVPFWLINLPLFWYLVYRTYESGFVESDDLWGVFQGFTIPKTEQKSRYLERNVEKLPSRSKLLNFHCVGRKNTHQCLVEDSAA